jgi:hypothetical protein
MSSRRLGLSLACALVGLLSLVPGSSRATAFTLGRSADLGSPALDPLVAAGQQSGSLAVASGTEFTVVLGLHEEDRIFAYTLDLAIAGPLTLLAATQLACYAEGGGCAGFFSDPTDPSSSLRASVLEIEPLSILGSGGGPPGLLALTFLAGDLSVQGGEISIGFLHALDAITGIDDRDPGFPLALEPAPSVIQLTVVPVPEPGTGALLALGVLGLASRRLRRARAGLLALLVAGLAPGGEARAQSCDALSGLPLACDEAAEQATPDCQCRLALLLPAPPADASDLVSADELCGDAVAASPASAVARLARAATRILRVIGGNEAGIDPGRVTDSFAEMADAFALSVEGRNLYLWEARLPRRLPDGTPCQDDLPDGTRCRIELPASSPGGGEVQEALVGLLAPALAASVEDLGAIAADAVVTLCEPELATISGAIGAPLFDELDPAVAEVELDRGDVKLFQAALLVWRSQLLILDALNLEIDLDAYTPVEAAIRIQEEILDANPQLAALRPAMEASLAAAAQAERDAIDAYFAASDAIRTETDPQDEDLFTIETLAGEITSGDEREQELRGHLAGVRSALDRPTVVLDHDPFAPPLDPLIDEASWIAGLNESFDASGVALDLGHFFEVRPFSPRDVIPVFEFDEFEQRNRVVSLPDRTFRGTFVPAQDEEDLGPFLDCYGSEPPLDFGCLASDIDGDGYVGGRDYTNFLTGLLAVDAEPPPLPEPPPPACGLGFEAVLVLAPLLVRRRRHERA